MIYPSLYEKTGDIKDINTLLVPRESLNEPDTLPLTDAQKDALYALDALAERGISTTVGSLIAWLDAGGMHEVPARTVTRFNPAEGSPDTALQMAAIIQDRDCEANSVETDALRYRYLRDTPMEQWPAELLTIVRLQQNAKWDSAIDEALACPAARDTNV